MGRSSNAWCISKKIMCCKEAPAYVICMYTCNATVRNDEEDHVVLPILHSLGHAANVVNHRGVASRVGQGN